MVEDWLEGARCRANQKQFQFIELVADRLLVELNLITPEESIRPNGAEPLRCLLHGPPGTGKSHAVMMLEELFDLVGYKKGIDWEIVAFQTTNAADLEGKTIHNAVGLDITAGSLEKPVKSKTAQRIAYLRFLFTDEISMAPANLLGAAEMRIRQVKPSSDQYKYVPGSNFEERPFGGINFLPCGDFMQLPPPQGGYLAAIPHEYMDGPNDRSKPPDPMAAAGRAVMWEEVPCVVDLEERQRRQDDWWNEVTDELRAGHLSDKNRKYLHGEPVEGCQLTKEEKASRNRVISGPDDPRLQEPKFQEAPLILANNDSKYQVNKDRARKYAQNAKAELRWSQARDKASSHALQVDPCDKNRKLKSLGCRGKARSLSLPLYALCCRAVSE